MAIYQQTAKAVLRDDFGGRWDLRYYVATIENADKVTYGIKIERDVQDEKNSEETMGLTHSFEEAEAWSQKLAAGLVTPLCLHEVIDDLMN